MDRIVRMDRMNDDEHLFEVQDKNERLPVLLTCIWLPVDCGNQLTHHSVSKNSYTVILCIYEIVNHHSTTTKLFISIIITVMLTMV